MPIIMIIFDTDAMPNDIFPNSICNFHLLAKTLMTKAPTKPKVIEKNTFWIPNFQYSLYDSVLNYVYKPQTMLIIAIKVD